MGSKMINFANRKEVSELINIVLKDNVIVESTSMWSSPVVLVTTKDISTRFCADYPRVNEVTSKNSYSLARFDNILNNLIGSFSHIEF